jgi:hypothetical protein
VEDVYEYEPEGAGPQTARCGPAVDSGDQVFKPAHAYEVDGVAGEEPAGCVGLISSGSSSEESAFLDASGKGAGGEEGEDVFFMTAAKLAPQDVGSAMHIYDAHICTAALPCPAPASVPPECTTVDSCRTTAPPQPSIFAATGSATFNGAGNVAPPAPAKPVPPSAPQVRAKHLKTALATCEKRFPHSRKRRTTCERTARKKFGAKAPGKKPRGKG